MFGGYMPTRILREGIISSERVNQLSERAELFYRKLMSICDDYGRFFANPISILGACYPLRQSVRQSDVKRMLSECVSARLVVIYGNGKYLLLLDFNQQTRSKSKFPAPAKEELQSTCKADVKQMSRVVGGGGGVEDGGGADLPPAKQIAAEKELSRIVSELKDCGLLADQVKGSKKHNRILELRARQIELRALLGVVA
jgi:hypothetical protein